MGYTPLATDVHYTSQKSARGYPTNLFVLHHGATTSADQIIAMMTSGSRQVSSHAVVKDGRIAGVVEEEYRAWSLSSAEFDGRAFTVECANESTNGWTVSAASHESLARLVANWSTRYNIPIVRVGDPRSWTLLGHREVYSIWGASYATACPGGMDLDWIARRANEIKSGVTPEEDTNMQYIWTKDGGVKYALLDPSIIDGAWMSTNPADATMMSWLTWTKATQGAPLETNGTMFTEKLKAAKKVYSLRAQSSVDIDVKALAEALAPYMKGATSAELAAAVQDILKAIPTAAQNGTAARTAIVK